MEERDRLSVDRYFGSCEGNRPETPHHWEGLEAGQQLWPHEKIMVGAKVNSREAREARAGRAVSHWCAPCPG